VALERLTAFRFHLAAVAGVAMLGAAAVSLTLALGATRMGLAGTLGTLTAFVGMRSRRWWLFPSRQHRHLPRSAAFQWTVGGAALIACWFMVAAPTAAGVVGTAYLGGWVVLALGWSRFRRAIDTGSELASRWAVGYADWLPPLLVDRAATEFSLGPHVVDRLPTFGPEAVRRAFDTGRDAPLGIATAGLAERPWAWEQHLAWVDATLASGAGSAELLAHLRPPLGTYLWWTGPSPAAMHGARWAWALAAAGASDDARAALTELKWEYLPVTVRSDVVWRAGEAWLALGAPQQAAAAWTEGAGLPGWGGRRCRAALASGRAGVPGE